MDATLIGTYYGGVEGRTPWNYMADINADKCINAKDAVIIGGNFGKSGTYITDLASVTVAFNTGEELSPDSNRSILIPQYATSFTVKRYGVSIGAMIIFIGPASAPIAYSTNFEFTVPNDGDNDVHYYVMTKFYVPSALSGQTFYFIADADQGVEDLKLNAYTKACFGGQVNISLGILGGGYHLLEFEYVDIWLYGWLNFRVETASGQPAWLSRFRIYVPNYSNNACNYTVTTHTWCSMKDDYFLIGYANDSINNVCVDGLVWQDWMWDMGAYGAIYAWGDGFCYPLGNLENNTGLNAYSISFNFTEIWEAGMLDFQYISRTSQSGRIGRPKFYASAEIDNLGTYMTLNNAKIYGGSLWADSPGVSERNVTILTTHNISYNDGDSWFNTILAVEIGNWWATWELGASQPPDVAIPLNFTVVNLTSNLRSGLVLNTLFFWEVSLKDYTIDVYSFQNLPITGIEAAGEGQSNGIIDPGYIIALDFAGTTIMTASAFTGAYSPIGAVVGLGVSGMAAILDYVQGQQVSKYSETIKESNRWQLTANELIVLCPDTNSSHSESQSDLVFMKFQPNAGYHCGLTKIVLKGTLQVSYYIVPGEGWPVCYDYPIGNIDITLCIPWFIWSQT